MKATTTEEKNKVLVEFMEYKHHEEYRDQFDEFHAERWSKDDERDLCSLNYDESYDWLMPVWRKFRDLNTPVLWGDNLSKFHNMSKEIARSIVCENTPDKAFDLLVEAVEWYNSINDKKE